MPAPTPLPFPDTLRLRALSLELEVARSPVPHLTDPAVRVLDHRPAALRLTVQHRAAPLPPSEDFREALVGFLRREGARALPPRLARLADEAGIARPSHVRVGLTRSRWASRSSTGTIACSVLLLFLPEALLRHVLLHELCHVAHMDHGPGFHALLARLDPLSAAHAKALRHADRDYLPRWLSHDEPDFDFSPNKQYTDRQT